MRFPKSSKLIFLVGYSVLVLLSSGCVETARFEGRSMVPTIKDGDKILLTTDLENLKRGDIISFKFPEDKRKVHIKRIIGLPYETIEIREGKVFVDSQKVDEPYLDQTFNKHSTEFKKKIPANEYFVMGDNRDHSSDSRYWGTVNRKLIVGKYWITYDSVD